MRESLFCALVCALVGCGPPRAPAEPDGGAGGGPDAWGAPPDEPYVFEGVPASFPLPEVPAGEPLTRPRVELGRHLFYDARLSANGQQSCASCHQQERAFSDGRQTSRGSTGQPHFRNAPPVFNVGFLKAYTWADPGNLTLHGQARGPLFGTVVIELGNDARDEAALMARLRSEPRYQVLFPLAFKEEPDPFTVRNLTLALAAFERTIISYRSPYDRATFGQEPQALSETARRGLVLLQGEHLACGACHGGVNFSSALGNSGRPLATAQYFNVGLYNLDGGRYPAIDPGIRGVTGRAEDEGKFRPPSLRNVALTAPYFHDGSAATLAEVVDHYARGGRLTATGPHAGDGALNPYKDPRVAGFRLTPQQQADGTDYEWRRELVAALEALTDLELTRDPRYADPWK